MRDLTALLAFLGGLLLVASDTSAGCRDDEFADNCGLALLVTVDGSVCAPNDSVSFSMELSNRGNQPVYIPGSFFRYGPLPCAVLPSGKVENFKATIPAPECDMLPGDGDIILEAGASVTFTRSHAVLPEPGVQLWSFEGVLYKCPAVSHLMNCEIESNTVELVVRSVR